MQPKQPNRSQHPIAPMVIRDPVTPSHTQSHAQSYPVTRPGMPTRTDCSMASNANEQKSRGHRQSPSTNLSPFARGTAKCGDVKVILHGCVVGKHKVLPLLQMTALVATHGELPPGTSRFPFSFALRGEEAQSYEGYQVTVRCLHECGGQLSCHF